MNSREKIILFLLIALHLSINIPLLGYLTIDLDEPFSIFHSQHSPGELFQLFKHENNPPLHFLLLHYWIKLFGIGPAAVRSLSLLFSVLTIPVLFSIGKRFINRNGAVILPALFIFSDFHHYYALEARPYSLLVLEFSVLFFFILKILCEGGTRKDFLSLGILNALLFYTHYISLYFFPAEAIVFLVFSRQLQLRRLAIAVTVFVVFVAPWVPVLLERVKTVSSGGTWVLKPQFSELYGFINKFFNDKWALLALVLSLFALIVANRRHVFPTLSAQRKKIAVSALLFGISYISAFAVSFRFSSVFLDRYLFFLTIPLFFLAALFFAGLRYGTICFASFLAVYLLRFDLWPENNRNSAQIADDARQAHASSILIAPNYYDLAFLYHYDRRIFAAPDEQTFRKLEKKAGVLPIYSQEDKLFAGNPESILLIGGEDAGFLTFELEKQLDVAYIANIQKTYPGGYKSVLFIRR